MRTYSIHLINYYLWTLFSSLFLARLPFGCLRLFRFFCSVCGLAFFYSYFLIGALFIFCIFFLFNRWRFFLWFILLNFIFFARFSLVNRFFLLVSCFLLFVCILFRRGSFCFSRILFY